MADFDATIEDDLNDAQSPRRRSLASQSSKGSFGPFMFLEETDNNSADDICIDDEQSLDSTELRAQDAEIANSIRRESFSRAREVVDDEELFQQFKATMNKSGQKINSTVHIHQVLSVTKRRRPNPTTCKRRLQGLGGRTSRSEGGRRPLSRRCLLLPWHWKRRRRRYRARKEKVPIGGEAGTSAKPATIAAQTLHPDPKTRFTILPRQHSSRHIRKSHPS